MKAACLGPHGCTSPDKPGSSRASFPFARALCSTQLTDLPTPGAFPDSWQRCLLSISLAAGAEHQVSRVGVRNVSCSGIGLGLLFSHSRWGNTQLLRAALTFSAGQAVSAGAQLLKKASVKNVRALSRAHGWFSCHAGMDSEAE